MAHKRIQWIQQRVGGSSIPQKCHVYFMHIYGVVVRRVMFCSEAHPKASVICVTCKVYKLLRSVEFLTYFQFFGFPIHSSIMGQMKASLPYAVNPLPFSGKFIAVTGASRGLGLALCKYLLIRGAAVSMCATSVENLSKATKEIRQRTPRCEGSLSDVDRRHCQPRQRAVLDRRDSGSIWKVGWRRKCRW